MIGNNKSYVIWDTIYNTHLIKMAINAFYHDLKWWILFLKGFYIFLNFLVFLGIPDIKIISKIIFKWEMIFIYF